MNISTLSRFLMAITAALFISSALAAQEADKTTNKKSTAVATKKTDPAFDQGITPDKDFYKTDPSFWDHGIARMWAGFYVRFTPENVKQYLYGNTVVFANGEKRKIIGSSVNGDGAWDVRVEGDKLDYTEVGSPAKFKVIIAPRPTRTSAAPAVATSTTPAASPISTTAATPTKTKVKDDAPKATPTAEPKKGFLDRLF